MFLIKYHINNFITLLLYNYETKTIDIKNN